MKTFCQNKHKLRDTTNHANPLLHGFTLIELLVVVAIIAVLVAILLPSLQRARSMARQVTCLSNMRNFAMGAQMYSQDNNGKMLPMNAGPGIENYWTTLIAPYVGGKREENTSTPTFNLNIRRCPSGTANIGVDYGGWSFWRFGPVCYTYNSASGTYYPAITESSVKDPSSWIQFADVTNYGDVNNINPFMYSPNRYWAFDTDYDDDSILDSCSRVLSGDAPYNRGAPRAHMNGSNVSFCDGSARWISMEEWATNIDLWSDD